MMQVRDALLEKDDDDGNFCQCGASALDDGPHCRDCASYWKDCENGLWADEPTPTESPA